VSERRERIGGGARRPSSRLVSTTSRCPRDGTPRQRWPLRAGHQLRSTPATTDRYRKVRSHGRLAIYETSVTDAPSPAVPWPIG